MDFKTLTYLIPVLGVVGLLYTFVKSSWVTKQDVGTDRMGTIASHIAEGAMSFLKTEYKILAIFVIIVAILLGLQGSQVENSSKSP